MKINIGVDERLCREHFNWKAVILNEGGLPSVPSSLGNPSQGLGLVVWLKA